MDRVTHIDKLFADTWFVTYKDASTKKNPRLFYYQGKNTFDFRFHNCITLDGGFIQFTYRTKVIVIKIDFLNTFTRRDLENVPQQLRGIRNA